MLTVVFWPISVNSLNNQQYIKSEESVCVNADAYRFFVFLYPDMTKINNMKKFFLVVATTLTLFSCTQRQPVVVTVTNPLSVDRNGEMIEVSMAEIAAKLRLPDTAQVVVLDENNLETPYQITYNDMLIFPASVKASATATYTIRTGIPKPVDVVSCGRIYPERLDDVAWENDRAAYRAYGPALQASGEKGYGYDIWTKNTMEPVVEDRYDGDLNRGVSYHVDHGNGMDVYAVGPTLGGGTTALYPDSSIVYPYCYKECEVLDNGPLRFTAKLVYNPLVVKGDSNVVETRIISLDKGSQLNKTIVSYSNLQEITPMVAGIVLHKENPMGYSYSADAGYIAYADSTQNAHNGNGVIYVGAVVPVNLHEVKAQLFLESEQKEHGGALGHVLAISNYEPGTEFVYYWGSGWSKYGFAADTDWTRYLEEFAKKIRNPLTVTVQ